MFVFNLRIFKCLKLLKDKLVTNQITFWKMDIYLGTSIMRKWDTYFAECVSYIFKFYTLQIRVSSN